MTVYAVAVRRVFPLPVLDAVSVSEMYGFARLAHSDGLPVVEICMIATPDGAISVDGRSGPLGSPDDRAVLLALRQAADIVLVGAGTARAEPYSRPSKVGQRIAVVSRSGNIDTTTDLFTSGAGLLVIPRSAPTPKVSHIRAGDTWVDFNEALAQLDVAFVHAEGGSQINTELLNAGVVDAINLSLAPSLCGGDGIRIASSAVPHYFDLAHVCSADDYTFVRYERKKY